MADPLDPAKPVPSGAPGEVFSAFLKLGLTSFGGPVAHLGYFHAEFVRRRQWLSERGYADLVALCQFLPGPNIINVAICIDLRFRGPLGALTALAGVVLVPFALIIVLATLYLRFSQLPGLHGALSGLAAAAAGLIVAMGVKMAQPLRRRRAALLFCGLAFLAVGFMLHILEPILVPFVIAVFLSRIFSPLNAALRRRRVPAALSILLVLILVSIGILIFFWVLYTSGQSFRDALPQYQARLKEMFPDG